MSDSDENDSHVSGDAPPPPSENSANRRARLFLGDTEQFTFSFGADEADDREASDNNSGSAGGGVSDGNLPAGEAAPDAAAAADTAATGTEEGGEAVLTPEGEQEMIRQQLRRRAEAAVPYTPLTLAQVRQYAARSLKEESANFLLLPRLAGSGGGGKDGKAAEGPARRVTLDQAMELFSDGVRQFDEALWRLHKAKVAEEKKRRQSHHQHKREAHKTHKKKAH